MALTAAGGAGTSSDSSTPYIVIAVLAVLLILVVMAGVVYFAVQKKKKSGSNQSATGDGHVYNTEGSAVAASAQSWAFVAEKCEDEVEHHSFVDSDCAAAVSTKSDNVHHGGNDDGEMMTAEMVKDASEF